MPRVLEQWQTFDELIAEAKKHEMYLIVDAVLCHTLDQHKWFQRAIAFEEKCQRSYTLRDGRNKKSVDDSGESPTNWQYAFDSSVWQREPHLKMVHDVSQPDLN